MKRKSFFIVFALVVLTSLLLSACRQNARPNGGGRTSTEAPAGTPGADTDTTQPLSFQIGRNDYVINVDDTPRKFIIHVPVEYDASQPTPVVFMFHGTNGSGEAVYESTHWAKKADEVTAIVVFPSSWRYFLITENDDAAKWNDAGMDRLVSPDTELKDDVKFTRMMLNLLRVTFNVDEKRIFATGFSNGGGFVTTRLMMEMSDTFAAFSTSGSGTKLSESWFAATMPPKVSRSYYSIMGTQDDVISAGQGVPLPFPFNAEAIVANEIFGAMLVNTATYLNLDPSRYEISHPRDVYTVFLYNQSLTDDDNEYIFQMIKGMFHVYPDGQTLPGGLDAVEVFWEFFIRHPMK